MRRIIFLLLITFSQTGNSDGYTVDIKGLLKERCLNPKECITYVVARQSTLLTKVKEVTITQSVTEESYNYMLTSKFLKGGIKFIINQYCSLPPVCELLASTMYTSDEIKDSVDFNSQYKDVNYPSVLWYFNKP